MRSAIALLVVCAALANAHLCLVHPPQRNGGAGMSSPGADSCKLVTGPCGGDPEGSPKHTVTAGGTTELVIQKNLDHFNKEMPGNFTVYGFNGSLRSPMQALLPDTNATSLSLYKVSLPCPSNTPAGNYVLQVVYNTNNPEAPAQFFQCADVKVVAAPRHEQE